MKNQKKEPFRATARDIQTWLPQKFSHFAGNARLIAFFQDAVRMHGEIANTLVTGDSRTGKTAAVKLCIKSLYCTNRDPVTMDPCGTCKSCTADIGTYEKTGIYAFEEDDSDGPFTLHFVPINCPLITEEKLRSELADLREFDGLRIVYLDEVHRLARRKMDEMLLKHLEERNFVWIASSATTRDLERMFLNRFPFKLRTALPTREELAMFLARRCKAWELDWDEDSTLIRLAERSNQITGCALQVLMAATKPGRILTRDMVESHDFEEEES